MINLQEKLPLHPGIQEAELVNYALQESGQRYREMMDALPAAVYTTDAKGRLTYFNPACIELSGRVPDLHTDSWCVTWKLFHPDGSPMPHDTCPMALSLKERRLVRGAEAIAERPDGTRIWIAPYPTPLKDAEGQLVGGINMLVDITERKRAEQALRERDERFGAFMSATSDVVYRMNRDWTEVREVHGREFIADTLEPSTKWLSKYIHPDDQQQVMASVEQAIDTKSTFELEHRVIRTDGSLGWTHSRAIPILDNTGAVVEWFGAASDVTRRKQAEEALTHQRRLYEGVLSTTPDLAYIFDLDHRFIYANEGLLSMWGKSWDEAIGKTCLELGYEPWHAELHDREIEQVVATKQPIRGVVPFTGRFGRRLYDYILTPVLDANGEVQAVAGTTRDVTDIKQSEQALRDSEEQLARELAGMKRLHVLSIRLAQQDDLTEVMREVMEAAGELLGSERVTAQCCRFSRAVAAIGRRPWIRSELRRALPGCRRRWLYHMRCGARSAGARNCRGPYVELRVRRVSCDCGADGNCRRHVHTANWRRWGAPRGFHDLLEPAACPGRTSVETTGFVCATGCPAVRAARSRAGAARKPRAIGK